MGRHLAVGLLWLAGCTDLNPAYLSGRDLRGASDGASPRIDLAGADLAGLDLTAAPPDLSAPPAADDAATPPDLTAAADLLPAPPDLSVLLGGPSDDVAEDVLATWDVGESTDDTVQACTPMARGLVSLAAAEPAHVKVGAQAVRVNYGPNGASYFQGLYPRTRNAGWDLSKRAGVRFLLDAQLPKDFGGWDPLGPTVVLCNGPGAYRRLDPSPNQLPRDGAGYTPLMVPLAGGGAWKSADTGNFDLKKVQWIEIHMDPLRNNGMGTVSVWLDDVRFY